MKKIEVSELTENFFETISKECDIYGEMFEVNLVQSLSGIEGGAK